MKLYTVVHQGRTLVCLETQGGTLVPLPYQSMNHLLMDELESRDAVLERAAQSLGTLTLGAVEVLAPIPQIGVWGIWAAIPIGWSLADVTGVLYLRRSDRKGGR